MKLRWNGSDGTCEALGSELGRTAVSAGDELEVSDELGESLLGSTSLWERASEARKVVAPRPAEGDKS